MPIDRRQFLHLSAAAVAARWIQDAPASRPAALPAVALGKTGRVVPRLGLGCYPICQLPKEREAVDVLRHAFAQGIRYLDTAPSYGAGASETRIGLALDGFDRKEFFLATKTLERRADGARRELEQSLKRLRVDFVDSVQVHEVHDDVETVFAKGSVLEGLAKAREEGLVRWIGVTGHRDPKWVLAALERHEFATALVPVNPIDLQLHSFVKELLPKARARGVAVIAMKIFAAGALVAEGRVTARECLDWAFAQKDATVLVPGCRTIAEVDEALAAARAPESPSAVRLAEIERKVGTHGGKSTEWYKDPP